MSDVDGEATVAIAPSAAASSSRRQAVAQGSVARARSSGDTDGNCFACGQRNPDKQYKGIMLHTNPCYQAVRKRKHQTRHSERMTAEDDRDIRANPDRWRESHAPFLSDDATVRRHAAADIQERIRFEEEVETKGTKKIADKILLNKRRYVAHVRFWDGKGDTSASEDFEGLHSAQGGAHDRSDGEGDSEARVAVDDNVRLRSSEGKKKITGRRAYVVEDGTHSAPGGGRISTRGSGSQRSRSPPPTRRSRGRSAARSPPGDDNGFQFGGRAAALGFGSQRGSPRRRSSQAGSPRRSRSQPRSGRKKGRGPREPQTDCFEQTKDALKAEISTLRDRVTGPKGIKIELAEAMAALMKRGGTQKDLPVAPSLLEENFVALIGRIDAVYARTDGISRSEAPQIEHELVIMSEEVSNVESTVSEQLHSIEYKKGKAQSVVRQQYMSRRWVELKFSQRLIAGGYTKNLAKHLAVHIASVDDTEVAEQPETVTFLSKTLEDAGVNPPKENFDFSKLAGWTPDNIAAPFVDLFAKNKQHIDEKMATFKSSMSENIQWKGALGWVKSFDWGENPEIAGQALSGMEKPGAKVWAIACRESAQRGVPWGVTLPGVPAVVKSLEHTLFVHGVPMKAVLAEGIAFANYDSFLASSSGPEFLKEKSWFCRVPVGHTIFIPPGQYYYILFVDRQYKKPTGKLGQKQPEPCSCSVHAVLTWDGATKLLTSQELLAMHKLNEPVFASKEKLEMWKERKAWFEAHFPASAPTMAAEEKDGEKEQDGS